MASVRRQLIQPDPSREAIGMGSAVNPNEQDFGSVGEGEREAGERGGGGGEPQRDRSPRRMPQA